MNLIFIVMGKWRESPEELLRRRMAVEKSRENTRQKYCWFSKRIHKTFYAKIDVPLCKDCSVQKKSKLV